MRARTSFALLLAVPALVAGCAGGSDDVADHPACEPVERFIASYQSQDWDQMDAASDEIRTAIAIADDDRLIPLREAVIGARNDALAETFWIPPDERQLVATLLAADPGALDDADRRLRADILRTRVDDAPERLPDPPRSDPGARAFLASAAATCGLSEGS